MKAVKITKTMLKDAVTLLEKVGAVEGNHAYPSHVYMSQKDYTKLEKNVKAAFKKEYPYLNSRKLESSVGMHLLGFGPVSLKQGIAEGFVLVDVKSIEAEIEENSSEKSE